MIRHRPLRMVNTTNNLAPDSGQPRYQSITNYAIVGHHDMEAAMNVSLTPELEKKIEARVATGNYTSASELVREALRLFFEIDESRRDEIAAMNRRIAQGMAKLDRGEGIAGDEARRRSVKRLAARPGRRRG